MNTPREILLARHRAAEPKLDQVRASVLAKLAAESTPEPRRDRTSEPREFFSGLRFVFGLLRAMRPNVVGLGGVWLLILVFRLTTPEPPINTAIRASASSPAMQAALAEQQRLLAELGELPEPRLHRGTPKPDAARPRSERRQNCASV